MSKESVSLTVDPSRSDDMPSRRAQARATRDKTLVSDLLKSRSADEDHTPELRARRQRLLTHPGIPKVIRRLITFSHPEQGGDDVRAFMDFSFTLPEYWEYRKSRPKDFVYADTQDLATHASAFGAALKQHSDLLLFYLGESQDRGRHHWAKAQRRLDFLRRAVTHIYDRAAARRHYLSNKDIPPPPKLPGHVKAREQFCIRALALQAEKLFWDKASFRLAKGGGLHPAIALLVSTALGLKEPLTPENVKQFLRHY